MDDELRGWKAIADHLGTSDRTAQRWERDFGLPVRRAGNSRGSTVVATRRELDEWRHSAAGSSADTNPPGNHPAGPPTPGDAGTPGQPRWRSSRALVVAAAGVVLLGAAAWVAFRAATGARQAGRQPAEASASSAPRAGQYGPAPVVVLKLTADTGEAWTVRLVEGATATWEAAGGRTLGLAVDRAGSRARLTVSTVGGGEPGGAPPATVAVLPLEPGAAAPFADGGRRVNVEWIGAEAGPSNRAAPPGVAPPRCCLACGGVTVCATEVSGWCGSCCDPRYTSCRPPI